MVSKPNILIICEGYEEYEYLEAIIKLNVWEHYNIDLINAESNGSIFPIYQYNYQNDGFDLILIMADTDRPTYDDYLAMLKKINDFHGVKDFADEIVIYGNSCTMQFILNHFSQECICVTRSNKKKNSEVIEKLTGVENYDAHKEQRKSIFCRITKDNYEMMKMNLIKCHDKYDQISSTNFLKFIRNLESEDTSWIDIIMKKI